MPVGWSVDNLNHLDDKQNQLLPICDYSTGHICSCIAGNSCAIATSVYIPLFQGPFPSLEWGLGANPCLGYNRKNIFIKRV